jgi:queuosine precursor transporter
MTRRYGYVALAIYIACIPAANWTIQHVGHQAAPGAPHTIPVGFGYDAPSGVLWIGLALVMRDVVQQTFGRLVVLAAIAAGAILSLAVAPAFALASAAAFGIGELADFGVYTPLAERRLYAAVLLSGIVGAVVDSLLFLQLAFGSTEFWQGNVIGKVWFSVAALPALWLLRRRQPEICWACDGATDETEHSCGR